MGKICFYCDKEIEDSERYQFLGIDVPYLNLFFHKETCWKEVSGNINSFLTSNVEKVYNYKKIDENKRKK